MQDLTNDQAPRHAHYKMAPCGCAKGAAHHTRHDTVRHELEHDKPEGTTRKHEQTSLKAQHDKKPDILTLIIIINFYLSIIYKLK